MSLSPDSFSRYFQAVHGYDPFPWQDRLLCEVARHSSWPESLTLPTASGKTSVLDVAVFNLALSAQKGSGRYAPRRILFVVDRRLVVDDAFSRAEKIAKALREAEEGILREVADCLLSLGGDDPLKVIRLRGGIPREDFLMRSPLQPGIYLSTVDQVGSRLLFRGYGVSEFSRPIHAGMLAHDSILFIDEAHMSMPFLQTAQLIRHYQGPKWQECSVLKPITMVYMTATPQASGFQEGKKVGSSFSLAKDDFSNKVLSRRLNAAKPTLLVDTTKLLSPDRDEEWENHVAKQANAMLGDLLKGKYPPVVGVVVNRVSSARAIFKKLSAVEDADGLLLIGRNRPLDREKFLETYLPRIRAGRASEANPKPLFVVATQTVEVGADLDFDGLVTELAPLDALIQRFGRLNRIGRRKEAPAAILFHRDRHGKEDPVYGDSLPEAWKWLKERANGKGAKGKASIDFSFNALLEDKKPIPPDAKSPMKAGPLLMPSHVDLLVQTSPSPLPDPAVQVFLHGIESGPPEVQLIWRGDLPSDLLSMDTEALASVISALPPSSQEAISLPLPVVRNWLRGKWEYPNSDLEGEKEADSRKTQQGNGRYCFCWKGLEDSSLKSPEEIRPGDVLVVPCSYGGMDLFGWDPYSHAPVRDLAELVLRKNGKPKITRFHPSLLRDRFADGCPDEILHEADQGFREILTHFPDSTIEDIAIEMLDWLCGFENLDPGYRDTLIQLKGIGYRVIPYPSGKPNRLSGFFLVPKCLRTGQDEDDRSSLSRCVMLPIHEEHVENQIKEFSALLGIPLEIAEDLALAARTHDLGKTDPRFQAWLRSGLPIGLKDEGDLAKSDMNSFDRNQIAAARVASGYPSGGRHEMTSVGLLNHYPELLSAAHDEMLVKYLVGSHHGRGRPFMPVVEDEGIRASAVWNGQPLSLSPPYGLEGLDSGWTDMFWVLVRRYGWWTLSYMETLLRLADQQQSEKEMSQ